MELTARDEGRHEVGAEPLWGESWYHDWAAADGSYGGYLRLGMYPNQGVVWYWVALVARDQPLLLVRNHDVPAPTAMDGPIGVSSGAVRGTWGPIDPLRSYRITSEGTGVALVDPADAFHGENGREVSFSLDLTWDGAASCFPYSATTRFEQSAWVRGDVTVDGKHTAVDCPGQRDHSWGVRDWWAFAWMWCSGRLDDGTWWHSVVSGLGAPTPFAVGYVVEPGATDWRAAKDIALDHEVDAEQLPTGATLTIDGLELRITPELLAPVLLESKDGKVTRFPRAMSSVTTTDGRMGHCWLEFNFPQPS